MPTDLHSPCTRTSILLASLVAAVSGCSRCADPSPFPEPTPVLPPPDYSAECEYLEELADPRDVALSPRPDPTVETLALAAGDGIVADSALYQTIWEDLELIRTRYPKMADITLSGARRPPTVMRAAAETAVEMDELRGGESPEWDCLRSYFGPVDIDAEADLARLNFERTFSARLAGVYEELPRIAAAFDESGIVIGGGDGICVRLTADDVRQYAFVERWGDCPSGCTESRAHHFQVTDDGTVRRSREQDLRQYVCP